MYVYAKISRTLGSIFFYFWQFFKQPLGIPVSKSPAFYEHNRDRPRIDPYFIFGKKCEKKKEEKKEERKQ